MAAIVGTGMLRQTKGLCVVPSLYDVGQDSVAEFESAAVQRHAEARNLLRRSHDLGAIYLYGYSIELRLKVAYFSTPGLLSKAGVAFGPADWISDDERRWAMKGWTALNVPRKANNGHDLEFWATLTVAKRAALAVPYPASFGVIMMAKAAEVYAEWRETLRYRATVPRVGLVRYVRDRADWFADNYRQLVG